MNSVSKHLPAKQDEAAVIALYSSAASAFALDDFVAATKEILSLETPKVRVSRLYHYQTDLPEEY